MGVLAGAGADGTTPDVLGAQINFTVDGTVSTNVVPGRLEFITANSSGTATERMRITSDGSVGIGTTGPIKPLSVEITSARSATTDNEAIRVSYGTNSGVQQSVSIGFATGVTQTNPAAKIELLEFDAVDSRGSLLFYTRDANSDTAPTERMRIDSSGYVRVNNTGGLDGQLSSLTGAWYAGAFANTSVAYPTAYSWSKATSGDNLFYQFFTEAGATSRGTIDYNRGAGLVRYNTTSDATLKNIIGD
jgi:hypothetical protein